jgi:quinol monooxygenase YgiN
MIMAVMITAEVKGQTQQGYDGILGMLADSLKKAPGFVLHTAHPVEGGWRVIEVWESDDDANQFFAKHVAPNLPPGIRPKRSVQELHGLVRG